MIKRVVWVAPVLVFVGLGSWWASSHARSTKARPSPALTTQELSARIAALEADTTNVREDLALTREATRSISRQITSFATTADARGATPDSPDSKPAQGEEGPGLAERQQVGMEILEQELHARVTSQPPDRRWAAAAEAAFRDKLAGLEGAPSFESTQCGTSLCSVTLSHEKDDAHVNLVNALQGNTQSFAGQLLVRRHPNPAGGFTTTFYFAKPGERIPDLQSALAGNY